LAKQGPIATLEGDFDFSGEDRFMFNGDQFVHFIAQIPRAVEASANAILLMSGDQVFFKSSYASYKNSNGDYRFVDGNPTSDGNGTGRPSGSYDHVIVGYNAPVTTDTIKFWAEEYIPVELIRVDYSYDGEYFFEVPTHVGSVSFIFDDAIKIYDTEEVPSGQYIYTVDLGKQYTAKYWRIRSFIFTHNMAKVTNVDGKDVLMATTSGLPPSSKEYGSPKFFYNNNDVATSTVTQETEYGYVTNNGDGTYGVEDVLFDTDSEIGTVLAGSCSITIDELVYNYSTVYECLGILDGHPECACSSYWTRYTHPECFFSKQVVSSIDTNTIYYVETTEDFNISTTSPTNINLTVDGYLPLYSDGQTGPGGGVIRITTRYSLGSSAKQIVHYNSITSNTLNTMDTPAGLGTDLEAGQNFYYSYDMKLTQVKIPERLGPQLRYWESDGSEAVTNTVVLDNIYDVTYDAADEVFYIVRFNETGGVGDPAISENFSSGPLGLFDNTRWSTTGNGFYRDGISACLVLNNTVSGEYISGDLVSKAYFTGDFNTTLSVATDTLSGTGHYGSVIRDSDNDNQLGGIYNVGEWGTGSSDRAVSAVVVDTLINGTDSVVSFSNFRITPYNLSEGTFNHLFNYLTGSGWYYSRENISSPGVDEVTDRYASPGPYVSEDGFSVMFDNNDRTISNGSSISFITERSTVSGINSDDILLYSAYTSSTSSIQFSYDDTVVNNTLLNRTIETMDVDLRANLTGASSNFITVSSTSFMVEGTLGWDVPCLEVYTINSDGALVEVANVSTAAGVALKTFDVIATPGWRYEDLFGQVSI
ncbi:MAG: hypothetical protein KAS32_29285, partial [Candidatus Peribacteraceae bacterium]|nr:hypothetical protein [Candidatus Peribacteraceae bacterium]